MRKLTLFLPIWALLGCQTAANDARVTPQTWAVEPRSAPPLGSGNAAAGQLVFRQVRCTACHSVFGAQPMARIPLPDFSKETPEKVVALILFRAESSPPAPVHGQASMEEVVDRLTSQNLADVVAYLRASTAVAGD